MSAALSVSNYDLMVKEYDSRRIGRDKCWYGDFSRIKKTYRCAWRTCSLLLLGAAGPEPVAAVDPAEGNQMLA